MAKMTVRSKKVWAALDDVARARLCESSGTEHSKTEALSDLSDLVGLFLGSEDDGEKEREKGRREKLDCDQSSWQCDLKTKERLQNLMGILIDDDQSGKSDDVKKMVCAETELACRILGNSSSEGFKRRLMSWLRQSGFDAGLCRSRWDKTARYPIGEHEYVDIVVAQTRYIIEVSFAGEFTIARPTSRFLSLLELFPQILVFKQDELKQVVRVMCGAMRQSMKKRSMHVPPWRCNDYMQAKWFSSYSRQTNTVSAVSKASGSSGESSGKRLVGFEALPAAHCPFRGEVGRKTGLQSCM